MPRSIAGQSVAELGGAGSVLARQRRDHVELDVLPSGRRSAPGGRRAGAPTRGTLALAT